MKKLLLILLTFLNSTFCFADFLYSKKEDPISGIVKHFMMIKSVSYKNYTNEEALHLTCKSDDGYHQMRWFKGGRYSQREISQKFFSKPKEIQYKIDDGEVIESDMVFISKKGIPLFLNQLAGNKRLFLKEKGVVHTTTFDIAGDEGHIASFLECVEISTGSLSNPT